MWPSKRIRTTSGFQQRDGKSRPSVTGISQFAVHRFYYVFANIQSQAADVGFVFRNIGAEDVQTFGDTFAVVFYRQQHFVFIGFYRYDDFGTFGVFYGVQNDIRQSVFQTLRFCESEDLFIDGVFQQDTGGFAIVGTVQLFDARGNLIDRIRAENIGCEYGEFDATGAYLPAEER